MSVQLTPNSFVCNSGTQPNQNMRIVGQKLSEGKIEHNLLVIKLACTFFCSYLFVYLIVFLSVVVYRSNDIILLFGVKYNYNNKPT